MTEPGNGKVTGWISAVKELTLTNVLIIALMAMVAIPVYFVYRVLNDPTMLDRFMSSYSETTDASGCTVRTVKLRGGAYHWSISSGFALSGSDRYTVGVIVDSEPKPESVATYCATLHLIVDKLQGVSNAP
jgi:hypothetical protein